MLVYQGGNVITQRGGSSSDHQDHAGSTPVARRLGQSLVLSKGSEAGPLLSV